MPASTVRFMSGRMASVVPLLATAVAVRRHRRAFSATARRWCVIVLLCGSAVLALAETSLVRMSRAKAMALDDDGRRGARSLVRLVENPQGFLNPVLLLVLICQLVVGHAGRASWSQHWFGAWGVVAATVFEVVVIFVLGRGGAQELGRADTPNGRRCSTAPRRRRPRRLPARPHRCRGLIGLANLLSGRRASRRSG